jgi:hypothetical protein
MNLNLHLVNLLALRICTKVGDAQGWDILSPQANRVLLFLSRLQVYPYDILKHFLRPVKAWAREKAHAGPAGSRLDSYLTCVAFLF